MIDFKLFSARRTRAGFFVEVGYLGIGGGRIPWFGYLFYVERDEFGWYFDLLYIVGTIKYLMWWRRINKGEK